MLSLGAFYNKMFMFQFLRVTRGMIMQKKPLKTPASHHHSFSLIATMDKALAIILLCALVHSTISLPFGPQGRAGPQEIDDRFRGSGAFAAQIEEACG